MLEKGQVFKHIVVDFLMELLQQGLGQGGLQSFLLFYVVLPLHVRGFVDVVDDPVLGTQGQGFLLFHSHEDLDVGFFFTFPRVDVVQDLPHTIDVVREEDAPHHRDENHR